MGKKKFTLEEGIYYLSQRGIKLATVQPKSVIDFVMGSFFTGMEYLLIPKTLEVGIGTWGVIDFVGKKKHVHWARG